jgi:hypothetical protein
MAKLHLVVICIVSFVIMAGCSEPTCEPRPKYSYLAILYYDGDASLDELETMFSSFGWNVTRTEVGLSGYVPGVARVSASLEAGGFRISLSGTFGEVNHPSQTEEHVRPAVTRIVDHLSPRYGEPVDIYYSGADTHCGPV